jgi:hypothetical protein
MAWREEWSGKLSQSELIDVLERALDALWRRAHLSLGEVTLMAIVDRVFHQASEKFPHLAALKVDTNGVNVGDLRASAPALDVKLLEESIVFLVAELMRVFGALTGEILTPGLHAELGKVKGRLTDEKGVKS